MVDDDDGDGGLLALLVFGIGAFVVGWLISRKQKEHEDRIVSINGKLDRLLAEQNQPLNVGLKRDNSGRVVELVDLRDM